MCNKAQKQPRDPKIDLAVQVVRKHAPAIVAAFGSEDLNALSESQDRLNAATQKVKDTEDMQARLVRDIIIIGN